MAWTYDPIANLKEKAAGLTRGEPLTAEVAGRAQAAAEIVAQAVQADPTLPERDRCHRDLDLIAELARQLLPLARQAEQLIASRRGEHVGRVNELAVDELEALSARLDELARQFAAQAWPDWDSPHRRLQRSTALLPDEHELAGVADELRRILAPALALSPTAPEALRLAALADQINPTRHVNGS